MNNKETILVGSNFFDNPNLKLHILKRDPELNYELHGHDFFELVLILSGKGIMFSETEEHLVEKGAVFSIPLNMRHGYKKVENLVLYNILLDKNLVTEGAYDLRLMNGYNQLFFPENNRINIFHLTPSQVDILVEYIESIRKESSNVLENQGSNAKVFALYNLMIVELSRIIVRKDYNSDRKKNVLDKILKYLNDNLNKTVTTDELMSLVHISQSTLNRYFKLYTGMAPIEYHLRKRINLACSLIHETDLSMDEISELTGFVDANYFSRQFKNIMKISPSSYKKAWKGWTQ